MTASATPPGFTKAQRRGGYGDGMRAILLAALLPIAAPAAAATVSIEVRGADGKPLAGAVVQLQGTHRPVSIGSFPGPFVVAQKDIAFQPHILVVPVGAAVSFPNRDKVRHHVYSFSPAKRFELKLYGQQETRSIVFDKPGVVALGCNIHDSMSGFVVVVDTPFASQTDARGHVAFDNVPAGTATVQVWGPTIRAAGNSVAQPLTVTAQGATATVALHR